MFIIAKMENSITNIVCGSGSPFRAAKIARRKGWIDKDTYEKMY